MRLAIFSDVHGNWTALQEVWAAIQREGGFDAVVCAGDLANGRPHPEECVQFLRDRRVECLLGNGELYLLGRATPSEDSVRRIPWLLDNIAWGSARLSQTSKDFLAQLPIVRRYPGSPTAAGPADDLLVCHATPHDLWPVCLPHAPDADWAAAMGPIDGAAVAFGHVHVPAVRRIDRTLYVNVAHAGLGDPQQVGYTILTSTPTGWHAERRTVPHDPHPERDYAISVGLPMSLSDLGY